MSGAHYFDDDPSVPSNPRPVEINLPDIALTLTSDRGVFAADRLDPTHGSWGVESVVEVLARAGPVVDECSGRDHVATVILCTHGDVASILLCSSLGVPLARHREVGALETGALMELTEVVG